ncbi:MAG: hypothetical protein FWE83_01605, partial [Oscillospiraceae bacterium]|nr:hypothetical protein [Oscillospiraceae bacterium]
MNEVIYKFLENSIIISAAVILLLVFSLLLGNKTSPMLRRTCWIFLALFFLIPVRPTVFTVSLPQEDSSPTLASIYSQVRDYGTMLDMRIPGRTFESPNNVGEPADEPGQPFDVQVNNTEIIGSDFNVNSESIPVIEQSVPRSLSISMIIPYIWMLGMITTLIFYTTGYTRFNRRIKRQAIRITGCVLNDLLDDVRSEIGLGRHIDLAVCPIISTPVVTGFFRPVIYLPDEFINYRDLRFILMHEATHIRNGDMWCKLLSLLVIIVHWFNPIVYLLNRAINIDSELACDTAVLRKVDEEQRMQYGETVFQAAKRSWQPEVKRYRLTESMLASAFSDSGKTLHRRLSAIIKRTNTKRWIAVCCALALSAGVITSGLVSCGSNEEDDDESGYTFVPEFTSLSALAHDIPNMGNITVARNSIYFTSTSEISKDALFRRTLIYTVDLDELALTYFSNYVPLPAPVDAEAGGFTINDLKIDNDGNIWVAETGVFFAFAFPDGFDFDSVEIDELMDYAIVLDELFTLRKLDSTGSELLTIGTSALIKSPQWQGISSLNIDGAGNIFIGSFMHIFVLNSDGELLFYLPTEDAAFRGRLVKLSDNEMSFFGRWNPAQTPSINRIDVLNQRWGRSIDLPGNIFHVFPGFEEFIAVINDGTSLSGIHYETGEATEILNWAASGVTPSLVENVTLLPDGMIILTNTTFEQRGDGNIIPRTELIMLHRTPHDELSGIITLTLLTGGLSSEVRSAIVEFNRTNSKYRVVTRDLDVNANSRNDDFNRLAVEIITGGGPDIIDTSGLPFYQWAGRGLFVDLYEFFDTDPFLERDNLLDVVLRSAETDGRLYRIFPDFTVWTMIGSANVVGSEPNWTFAEFAAQLEANPQATTAFGVLFDGEGLFRQIFMSNLDDFINWETGRVYFDSEDFIELL